MSALPPSRDDRIIWDTWLAMYRFPVITAMDEIGAFAALSAQALRTDELAAQLKVNARALGIQLGLVASLGFVEKREGRWRATAAARTCVRRCGTGRRRRAPHPIWWRSWGNRERDRPRGLLRAPLLPGTGQFGTASQGSERCRGAAPG